MIKPLVSIIIPTWNRAHLIGETLDSIIAQTYTNWECIVIDDGSTDVTEELLEDYCKKDVRFQYHQRPTQKPKGANSCRNYGFKLSKGMYIKWLDSDDLLYENAIMDSIEGFSASYVDVTICKLEIYNTKNLNSRKSNVIISENAIIDYLVGKIAYYISGPTWKRKFLEKQKQLFDPKISNLDDWDFNLRMLYNNPKINFIDKALIKYRIHDDSLSREIIKLNFNEIKSEFKAREKHVKLLKKNKMADVSLLKSFIKERYKYFLREALLQNSTLKFYFLKKTNIKQLVDLDFLGFFKTLSGFIVYSIFKKGYRFIK